MGYKRWIDEPLKLALKEMRAAILVGPRQSGKTTLVKALAPEQSDYRTLDDLTLLEAAQHDPHAFVKRGDDLMIIDEVQRVPELLLAIKKSVDENSERGQYLLPGSANIQQLPTVTESLAGRVAKLQLRPLAQGEILGAQPDFLSRSFTQEFKTPKDFYDSDRVIELALQGGFPEPLTLGSKARIRWHKNYLDALIDHDLTEIINIRRRDHLQQLLHVIAAWSSQYIDFSAIQSAISVPRPTLEAHLNALEALFLFERLPVFTKTDYARVGKRPKLYMNDTGMMAAILKWRAEDIRLDNKKLGKLIETLIYNEIATHVSCNEGYHLYHYRDREKHEIDLLVENDSGDLLGIDVKASSVVKKENFKHLQWLKENIVEEEQKFVGLVLYTGEKIVPFGENLWAVPMGCMWS